MSNQSGTANGRFPSSIIEGSLETFALCHKKTHEQCAAIDKLVDQLFSVDVRNATCHAASDAAAAIVNFFDVEARLHHEDEEQIFFPMLLALCIDPAEKSALLKIIEILSDDHRMLDKVWGQLRSALLAAAEGRPPSAKINIALATTFVTLQRHHMNCEDTGIMPFARRHLDKAALDNLRQAISTRRRAR